MNRDRALTFAMNGAIIALAALAGTRALDALRDMPPATRTSAAALIQTGVRMTALPIAWSGSPRHLLLFISPSCPACNRSVEAFAALARSAAAAGVRLSVVGREPEADLRAWLDAGGIAGAQIVRLQDPAGAGFLVSPTVLLADQTGLVTDFLSGAVKPGELAMLDARLRGLPGAARPVDDATFAAEIPASELPRWAEATRGQLVDVRNRGESAPPAAGARHIPLDELQPRALVELSRGVPVGVICEPDKIARCRASGRKLRMAGFEEVVVILPAEGPMR